MSEEYRARREEVRGKREEDSALSTPRSILLALPSSLLALSLLALPSSLFAQQQQGYTNHAGNVIAGWPVALTATRVSLVPGAGCLVPGAPASDVPVPSTKHQAPSTTYPLSIFPESEQRRIAVDFGTPRLPPAVKRAIAGAEKAMARSRKRADKGLCTKEESEAFCAKSSAALRAYLDKQVESGVITPAERKAVGK